MSETQIQTQVKEEKGAEVEHLDLNPLAKLIGVTYFTSIRNAIIEELNERGDPWGMLYIDPNANCYGDDDVFCHEIGYHVEFGKLGRELDNIFHEALHEFAKTKDGKEVCNIWVDKFGIEIVNCNINYINLVELFNKFVKHKLTSNNYILIAEADEGDIYIFLVRSEDP